MGQKLVTMFAMMLASVDRLRLKDVNERMTYTKQFLPNKVIVEPKILDIFKKYELQNRKDN